MFIIGNGSEIRFLAIFYVKAYDVDSSFEWVYTTFQILEIVLMILSGLLNTYTVYMCLTSNSFHPNITAIYAIYMLHWFELTISRAFVFPYQEGLLPLIPSEQEPDTLLVYTFDDTVINVGTFESHSSFILGARFRARYMLLVCFALPCVAIERSFATWFVRDYEQKSRAYISVTLIFMAETLATIGAYLLTNRTLSVLFLACTATVLQLASYGIVLKIKRKTKEFEKQCERNVEFYSLSVKFQIMENVQSFRVIHYLVVEVGIMIITTAVTITLGALDWVSSAHTVYVFYALEKLIHVNPLFICTAVFCIKPHWFRRLLRLMPGRLRHRTHAMDYAESGKSSQHRPSQADVHFEQLKKIW